MRFKKAYLLLVLLVIFNAIIFYLNPNKNNGSFDLSPDFNALKLANRPTNNKYVLYECNSSIECGEWADQLKGIMSAYAISLLTDRQLLIKINYPCTLENYLMPNEINWSTRYVDLKDLPRHDLLIEKNADFIQNEFVKINFLESNKHMNLIRVRTSVNLIQHLTLNKNHHPKITQLGYRLDEFNLEKLFFKWHNKLFKLTTDLSKKYDDMVKMTNVEQLICFQLRDNSSSNQITPKETYQEYWNFIQNNLIQKANFKLFFATNKQDALDRTIKKFNPNRVVSFKDKSLSSAKETLAGRESKVCRELGESYLDFMFMGRCKSGVISYSRFGMLAILNRKDSSETSNFYVLNQTNNPLQTNKQNLAFIRFNSSLIL